MERRSERLAVTIVERISTAGGGGGVVEQGAVWNKGVVGLGGYRRLALE